MEKAKGGVGSRVRGGDEGVGGENGYNYTWTTIKRHQ